jgi:hypothetical protein
VIKKARRRGITLRYVAGTRLKKEKRSTQTNTKLFATHGKKAKALVSERQWT